MTETLLSSSSIILYGVELADIQFTNARAYEGAGRSRNLLDQLKDEDSKSGAEDARLARIYAFAFAGEVFQMHAAAIFLVHGPGKEPQDMTATPRIPGPTDRSGVFAQSYDFSENVRCWTYDKNDISLRLDVSTGTMEGILLETELGGEDDDNGGGGNAVGGGRVGGGRVGGGRVGGGRVGGGRVGGGRVGSR